MNICIIDAKQFITDEKLIEPLYKLGNVSMYDGIPQSLDETIKRAKDADIVLFALMKFTNEIIDNLPNLKILQFIGTGVWNFVDALYAEKKALRFKH